MMLTIAKANAFQLINVNVRYYQTLKRITQRLRGRAAATVTLLCRGHALGLLLLFRDRVDAAQRVADRVRLRFQFARLVGPVPRDQHAVALLRLLPQLADQ